MTSTYKIDENGNKKWYNINGKFHREDGPAIEWCSGDKSWIINDKLHRLDGPAVEYVNNAKYWYINGRNYTKEQYWQKIYEMGLITKEQLFIELL